MGVTGGIRRGLRFLVLLALLLCNSACDRDSAADGEAGSSPAGATPPRPTVSIHDAAERGLVDQVRSHLHWGTDLSARNAHGWQPLHAAARHGRAEIVELLLSRDANPNARDASGYAPLHYAAAADPGVRVRIAEALLDRGADPNARGLNDATPLHLCVGIGSYLAAGAPTAQGSRADLMAVLLARKADPNASAKEGVTPLHAAVELRDIEAIELLLRHGADPGRGNATDALNPFHLAVFHGYEPAVEKMLASPHGARLVSATTRDGNTPLLLAAIRGDAKVVEMLVARGAAVDAVNRTGGTPLSAAIVFGHWECFRLLLDRGAAIDYRDLEKKTPLHIAAEFDRTGMIEQLLERGADPAAVDARGETPRQVAVRLKKTKAAEVLALADADRSAIDEKGRTALHRAVEQRRVSFVRRLLAAKASPDARDKEGSAPLHYAARLDVYGDPGPVIEIINLLIDAGASIDSRDYVSKGFMPVGHRTPLHYAAMGNRAAIAKVLLDRGANIHATDHDDQTPLHYAADAFGDLSTAQLLLDRGADPKRRDEYGCEVLHRALRGSAPQSYGLVKRLLDAGCSAKGTSDVHHPIHQAALYANAPVVRLLLDHGAPLEVRDVSGNTPLMTAVRNRDPQVVSLLLSRGADASALNRDGLSALDVAMAMQKPNEAAVKLLRDKKAPRADAFTRTIALHSGAMDEALRADPSLAALRDAAGDSLLIRALRDKSFEQAAVLIKHRAGINAAGRDGETPLMVAARDGNAEVVRELLDAGADVHATTVRGHTALHVAARECDQAIIDVLLARGANINARGKDGATPLSEVTNSRSDKRLEVARNLRARGARS